MPIATPYQKPKWHIDMQRYVNLHTFHQTHFQHESHYKIHMFRRHFDEEDGEDLMLPQRVLFSPLRFPHHLRFPTFSRSVSGATFVTQLDCPLPIRYYVLDGHGDH